MEANAKLQNCFASTDWKMFWDSSDGIEDFTTSVTGFINKCIDDFGSDARKMWQASQTIMDYKGKLSCDLPSEASLTRRAK